MHELSRQLSELKELVQTATSRLDLDAMRNRRDELGKEVAEPSFWNDPQTAQETAQEHAGLDKRVEAWDELLKGIHEALELAQLEDDSLQDELEAQTKVLREQFEAMEFELKLNGEYDDHAAIMHIHAGTGGTDAQDWAQMLMRMYLRWAERHEMRAEILDQSSAEEAGIKSADIRIVGEFAYGRLRSEHGVHRLVRQSPFNADSLRQTSFALVEVLPEIKEQDHVEIPETDLRVDVYRSGGNGGQSVNTTDSAVRITHIPSGISVAIQNERSQHQNRETAMTILRSRLIKLQSEQRAEELAQLKGPAQTEQWGQQIRNYVLHPYTLVKDTRTNTEDKDASSVLDGDIDLFIEAYLAHNIGE